MKMHHTNLAMNGVLGYIQANVIFNAMFAETVQCILLISVEFREAVLTGT